MYLTFLHQRYEDDKYIVSTARIAHSIDCYGYVIEEKITKGTLNAEKLKSLGLEPGPLYKEITEQWTEDFITLSNGQVIENKGLFGPPKRGRKAVILGDTHDPSNIRVLAENADVLIHECTLREEQKNLARIRGHSTASMGVKFANSIDAKYLIFNHFSPSFDENDFHSIEKYAEDNFKGKAFIANDFSIFNLNIERNF